MILRFNFLQPASAVQTSGALVRKLLESVAYIEHCGLLRGWAAAAELADPAALSGLALAAEGR
jgi:hypothetical protein